MRANEGVWRVCGGGEKGGTCCLLCKGCKWTLRVGSGEGVEGVSGGNGMLRRAHKPTNKKDSPIAYRCAKMKLSVTTSG